MPRTRMVIPDMRLAAAARIRSFPAMALIAGLALVCQAFVANAQTQAFPEPGTEFQECDNCPVMVVIPEGQYEMGAPPTSFGRFHTEGFLRSVTFSKPFALGKYEVTFDEWDACVADGKCVKAEDDGMGRGRRPVINVSWKEALAYAEWLARKTGKPYRLPSEGEWEYAGRAGGPLTRYLGIPPEKVCEHGNLYDASGFKKHEYDWDRVSCDDGHADTAPVGSYQPNSLGLHDMLGNVWEWTMDCENPSWRVAPSDGSPWTYGNCRQRAYRGGSWLEIVPHYLYPGHRYKYFNSRQRDLGFRVARTLP